jgi:hypothetical protein
MERKASGNSLARRERVAQRERVRRAKNLPFTPHPPLRGTLSLQERDEK